MVKTVVATAESGSDAIKRPWLGAELQDVTSDIADLARHGAARGRAGRRAFIPKARLPNPA